MNMLRAMGLRLWSAPVGAAQPAAPDAQPDAAPSPLPAAAAPAVSAPGRAAQNEILSTGPLDSPAASRQIAKSAETVSVPVWTPAPNADVAGMDWPALQQTVAGCRACALCQGRTQTVFGAGHQQGQWLIVGEAPGAQEDALGEPFVGPSGQLLDSMLQALGLSRQTDGEPNRSVYIANALKCRPPANRTPQAQELQACAPFLQRQIALQQPRTILAMGKTAAQALLGDPAPLGQLRGRVHSLGGSSVIVTYHPSYLLRSPGEKAKAWADLCLAADTAGLPQK